MKKRVLTTDVTAGPAHAAAIESQTFDRFHAIVEHLAVLRYDDGTARQPGTLLVRVVGSSWQVTAKEPDVDGQLVVTAPTLDDALAGLTLALEAPETPWQVDPWARKRSGKVNKKTG